MNSHEFAQLCNELLVHEALRFGIPRAAVRITRNIEDPDGGVDARIDDCPSVSSSVGLAGPAAASRGQATRPARARAAAREARRGWRVMVGSSRRQT